MLGAKAKIDEESNELRQGVGGNHGRKTRCVLGLMVHCDVGDRSGLA